MRTTVLVSVAALVGVFGGLFCGYQLAKSRYELRLEASAVLCENAQLTRHVKEREFALDQYFASNSPELKLALVQQIVMRTEALEKQFRDNETSAGLSRFTDGAEDWFAQDLALDLTRLGLLLEAAGAEDRAAATYAKVGAAFERAGQTVPLSKAKAIVRALDGQERARRSGDGGVGAPSVQGHPEPEPSFHSTPGGG